MVSRNFDKLFFLYRMSYSLGFAFYVSECPEIVKCNPIAFNQGLDYYQENLELKQDLAQVRKTVKTALKYAQTKLPKNESTKLSNLYFLIKEMLKAKDSVFGRKDLVLFPFWNSLTENIIFA